ncbi:hypothetical protein E2C01_050393 [Portunus trituberculatus]|uniref:Peptidase A2 domain-containing protein n=1 Tax=Portunus trituberculatus TaxID=210409 RepID=A0A5B7GBZ1_PORTR|nr:hypothetical protein [Portunus trituberculatus]
MEHQLSLCYRCEQKDYKPITCPYKSSACNYCHIKGHLEITCRKKPRRLKIEQVKHIRENEKYEALHAVLRETGTSLPKLEVPVQINGLTYKAELDTGAATNFITELLWHKLGTLPLHETSTSYASASQHKLPILVGDPCYVLYYGPRRDNDPRWVPATVIKRFGSRTVSVRVHPREPVWRRYLEQLRPPLTRRGCDASDTTVTKHSPRPVEIRQVKREREDSPPYGPGNPRRSKRERKPPSRLGY